MENGVTALTGIFFLLLCLAPASMDGLFLAVPAVIFYLLWKEKRIASFFLDPPLLGLLAFIVLALLNVLLGAGDYSKAIKLGRWIPPFLLGKFFVWKCPARLAPALLYGAGFIAALFAGAAILYALGLDSMGDASITLDDPELTFKNLSRAALYAGLAAFILFCHFLEAPSLWYVNLPPTLFLAGVLILAGRRATFSGFLACSALLLAARRKFVLLGLGLAVAVGGIIVLNQADRFNIAPEHLAAHQGITERQSVWYAAWKIFQEHPVLGAGVGTFRKKSDPFVQEWFARHPQHQRHEILSEPHNVILHTLAENGLAGTLLLLLVFAGAGATAWKARHATPGALCLCGCLGLVFVHIQLQVHTVTNVAVLIFLLLGMARGLVPAPEQPS